MYPTRPPETLGVPIAEASPFEGLTAYASIQFRIAVFPRHNYLHVITYTINSQQLHSECQEAELHIKILQV
jgi:hypothetical protein